MNIVLTLDYELFFGEETGSVSKTMVEATEKLLNVLDEYNIKAVFFVDVGFLKQLNHYKSKYPELEKDYDLIADQLRTLSKNGHDLQLHIHPHWEDSIYEDGRWKINADRYKLSDWPAGRVVEIVTEYKDILEQFTINNPIFAYRAGGFCIQPFDKIKAALKKNDIWLDSTVFEGGYNKSGTHFFDFKNIPARPNWNFEDNLLEADKDGSFLELPISSYKVSPIFYWKLALTRLVKDPRHRSFGDGSSLPASKKWLIKKLSLPSTICASIDGYKASYLDKTFEKRQKEYSDGNFVIIAHPKALTEYSLNEFRKFIENKILEHDFSTFSDLVANEVIKVPQTIDE
jgi:hypothetical protein